FPADRGGNAKMGNRLDDDAPAASSDRRQRCGREPECRRRAVLFERSERRLQIPRFDPHTNASRPLANLGSGRKAWPASVNRLVRSGYSTLLKTSAACLYDDTS